MWAGQSGCPSWEGIASFLSSGVVVGARPVCGLRLEDLLLGSWRLASSCAWLCSATRRSPGAWGQVTRARVWLSGAKTGTNCFRAKCFTEMEESVSHAYLGIMLCGGATPDIFLMLQPMC